MDIAIIANDKKKELIAEFCIAYCGVLSRHNLCATATTGKYISDSTGLEIERLLSGSHGGEQQIASRIAYDEVDILILFRDPSSPDSYLESECDPGSSLRFAQHSGRNQHRHGRGADYGAGPRRPRLAQQC